MRLKKLIIELYTQNFLYHVAHYIRQRNLRSYRDYNPCKILNCYNNYNRFVMRITLKKNFE